MGNKNGIEIPFGKVRKKLLRKERHYNLLFRVSLLGEIGGAVLTLAGGLSYIYGEGDPYLLFAGAVTQITCAYTGIRSVEERTKSRRRLKGLDNL